MRKYAIPLLLLAASAGAQPVAPLPEAIRLLREGKFGNAALLLNDYLRTSESAPEEAYLLLADAQTGIGNALMAWDACEQGGKRFPQSARIAKCLARLLMARNPALLATESYLQKAVSAQPPDPEAHYYYAQWACINNKDSVCVEQAKLALRLSAGNPLARLQLGTLLGVAYNRQNEEELADAAFQQALNANRTLRQFDYRTAFEYVRFLTGRNRNERALDINEEILGHAPDFPPGLFEKAKILSRERKLEEAAQTAERALAGAGGDKELVRGIRSLLARTYFALGEREKANAQQEWLRRQ